MCCLCLMNINRTPVVTVNSPSPKSEGHFYQCNGEVCYFDQHFLYFEGRGIENYLLCKFHLEKPPQPILNEYTYIFSYRRSSHFYDIHTRFARKKIIQVPAHQYKIAALTLDAIVLACQFQTVSV